jgi:hypothetical protein
MKRGDEGTASPLDEVKKLVAAGAFMVMKGRGLALLMPGASLSRPARWDHPPVVLYASAGPTFMRSQIALLVTPSS